MSIEVISTSLVSKIAEEHVCPNCGRGYQSGLSITDILTALDTLETTDSLHKDAAIGRIVRSYFISGNTIKIDRATIKRELISDFL